MFKYSLINEIPNSVPNCIKFIDESRCGQGAVKEPEAWVVETPRQSKNWEEGEDFQASRATIHFDWFKNI